MIELAPNHKRSLNLTGPLILAAGGYGSEYSREMLSAANAIVTGPISLRPTFAHQNARLREFPGGALVNRVGVNPGLAAVLSAQRHIWTRMTVPLILTLSGHDIAHWQELAARASGIHTIAALQLELFEELDVRQAVKEVRSETDLPLLALVPVHETVVVSESAREAGANCLVVGLGPLGLDRTEVENWEGRIIGPSTKPIGLKAVSDVCTRLVGVPLIAAGGVETALDVRDYMNAGAVAVEIDTVLWRNPRAILEIAEGLR